MVKKYGIYKITTILIIIACLFLSVYFKSRSFLIGYLVSAIYILYVSGFIKLSRKNIIAVVAMLIITVFTLASFVKTDSSLGRIFIYKVSWNIFKLNYLTGIGSGNFKIKYGLYQSAYFKSEHYTVKELLLADNTYFAFNDYWQFIIEHGVLIGLPILLFSIFAIINAFKRAHKASSDTNSFLKLATAQFIAVAAAALFDHVIENSFFQIFTVTILVYIFTVNRLRGVLQITFVIFIASSICLAKYSFQLIHYSAYTKFHKAQELSKFGYTTEALKLCDELFPILKDDVEFIQLYCDELEISTNHFKAIDILHYTLTKYTSQLLYQKLGRQYFSIANYPEAEKNYLIAVNMVPNRFTCRLELFNYYLNTGQMRKATAVGKFLLQMPVKIPSRRIEDIKRSIKEKIALL